MSKMPNLGGVFWCAVTILTISAGCTFVIFAAVKKKLFPNAGSPGLRLVSSRLQRAVIVAVGFAWAASAGALSFTERLVFSATDQSQWGSGPAVNLSNGGSGGFLGIQGFSEGNSYGEIACVPVVGFPCIGAEIGFQVGGRAGIDYDIKINSGSLSVYFPERVSFTLPDPLAVKIGRPFDIVTTLLPATILTFKPILQTIGPTVQAYVDMALQAGLKAVAQVCVALGCTGPRLEVGVDKTQELLSFNHNGDGQFRVLGGEVIPSGSGTVNRGPLNLRVQQPILNSDSRVKIEGFGGFDGTLLRSSDRGKVLDLSASLDKIVSDLLGLPPLNAKEGGFGYNIITANA